MLPFSLLLTHRCHTQALQLGACQNRYPAFVRVSSRAFAHRLPRRISVASARACAQYHHQACVSALYAIDKFCAGVSDAHLTSIGCELYPRLGTDNQDIFIYPGSSPSSHST
ncbi:uncharacterized protein ACHE_31321A [Aspergillus chevalieri]|uniref:Uncharacterized protein n=1 Tax=Aspergillus chevalieri TaxID=182096 RepID=A0A7R7ZN57_ASPCH|nr:uncharacterized protein ACHE_31321A [Aspergillus chevalieri]BCR87334.1 hypothetical protein ACHE_31321A [Aspergillus chevalieri]